MCSVFLSYGNRISIISNAELRYEGFLVASDSQKSTITLSKGILSFSPINSLPKEYFT